VGRPRRVYFLTEAGLERFPTRYLRLTIRLLEQLKETMPAPLVAQLFNQMAEDLAQDYTSQANLKNMPMEKRLEEMKNLLAQEGFNIQWERQGDEYHIHEVSCPYYHVGQNHPEVCTVDKTLISAVLNVPAQKTRCILNGDSTCTYIVPTQQENPA
jgi:predicted ArsR family transcriptional regulator